MFLVILFLPKPLNYLPCAFRWFVIICLQCRAEAEEVEATTGNIPHMWIGVAKGYGPGEIEARQTSCLASVSSS